MLEVIFWTRWYYFIGLGISTRVAHKRWQRQKLFAIWDRTVFVYLCHRHMPISRPEKVMFPYPNLIGCWRSTSHIIRNPCCRHTCWRIVGRDEIDRGTVPRRDKDLKGWSEIVRLYFSLKVFTVKCYHVVWDVSMTITSLNTWTLFQKSNLSDPLCWSFQQTDFVIIYHMIVVIIQIIIIISRSISLGNAVVCSAVMY